MLTWPWAGTKTGHRAAHSLPRVVLSLPSLKIRDPFPDGVGLILATECLRVARILQPWISGEKEGHKGQKRSGV